MGDVGEMLAIVSQAMRDEVKSICAGDTDAAGMGIAVALDAVALRIEDASAVSKQKGSIWPK